MLTGKLYISDIDSMYFIRYSMYFIRYTVYVIYVQYRYYEVNIHGNHTEQYQFSSHL